MPSHAGAPRSRRRFLTMSAGGAVAGAAALSGCALQVPYGVSGKGETVTVMVNSGDILPEQVKQAQKDLGIKIALVKYDITKLIAMLTSGNPPDLVRGVGAVDLPYFAARDVAEELDPYFARSGVLGLDDLDPVNDLWRFDGRTQGRGPRYGMAKDFSQDSMYWYNAAAFDKAGVDYPPETEPVTYEEWLDNAKRLVQRKNGQTTVFGGSFNGLTRSTLLATMTASAGGSLFNDDFSQADFTTPEARKALAWYIDYCKTKVGTSLIQPDPNGWDGPTYQAQALAPSIRADLIFAKLGMVDTYWPWVLWGLSAAPYLVFLFRQFFAGMPRELEEAAIVDGCGYTSIFWRIFLPQSWPVLSASFIIAFTWTWGDYIAPQLLLSTDRTTLAVAVMTTYVNEGGTPVPELQAAASVMYVVPILLIFLVAQRGFVAGMSTSGLK
ncbi:MULTISPECIES: extracellular solute-binding protein [unclassified Streptomyces]|uniref:extracellular solute-binding protein n=1 Tax=unclassified Streptomyces TaxID=2593676 RepID=UPI001F11570E|nr:MULTISPECIES: extracellular solute-binding protein [unclassified Streptomyces]